MRDGDVLPAASALGATDLSLPFGLFPLLLCPSGLVATGKEPFNLSVSQNTSPISIGCVDVLSHNQDVYGPSHVAHLLITTLYHNLLPHSILNTPQKYIPRRR